MNKYQNNVSDLARKQHDGEMEGRRLKAERASARAKQITPIIALLVANAIFISLDIRAIDVVFKLTNSALLSGATVIVSGILALLWWDLMYPHARRNSNSIQIKLSAAGVFLGIALSAILAFLDYLVGSAVIPQATLWGFVVLATAFQGILMAWWWLVDNSIEAQASRQKLAAARDDLQNTVDDFRAEIASLATVAEQLKLIKEQFPDTKQAAQAARSLGYETLARMLDDDDGDNIPNSKDPDFRGNFNTHRSSAAAACHGQGDRPVAERHEGQELFTNTEATRGNGKDPLFKS